jgi:putative MATE family efflux protein
MGRTKQNEIKLSDSFTYKKLIRFTAPSAVMMVFTSVYGVVDGFFVSRFAGKDAFCAVNFIMPYLMLLGAVGFMIGAGGSALVAKTLGEGKREKANRIFSLLVYTSLAVGIIFAFFGIIFLRPVAELLGASGRLATDCVAYGTVILFSLPTFIVQCEFQSFCITAEKPKLGLTITVVSGVMNIILDALLVGVFGLGLMGAAAATAISQLIGGAIPLFFFSLSKSSLLRLSRAVFDGAALIRVAANGSSELMSNIAMSVISMLYNAQLMRYAGEDGVSAYGVLMYVGFIFVAIFFGYSAGSAPVISFHYGAGNREELRGLLGKSAVIIVAISLSMTVLAYSLSYPLSLLFVGYDDELFRITLGAFFIYSSSFLFSGISIFGSAFFTALNNGPVSAAISFLRTFVFQISAVLLLPLLLGIDGIWLSIVAADFFAALITLLFIIAKRQKYGYLPIRIRP